jgi:hypothetical protein
MARQIPTEWHGKRAKVRPIRQNAREIEITVEDSNETGLFAKVQLADVEHDVFILWASLSHLELLEAPDEFSPQIGRA